MKKQIVLAVIIILIIFGLSAYHYSSISYKRVEVYTSKNFKKEDAGPLISVGNKNSLKAISRAISTGRKIDGKLDVAPPNYILDIYDYKNRLTSLYLWLDNDSINGMYLYLGKTETGYTITEEGTEHLKKIISINQ